MVSAWWWMFGKFPLRRSLRYVLAADDNGVFGGEVWFGFNGKTPKMSRAPCDECWFSVANVPYGGLESLISPTLLCCFFSDVTKHCVIRGAVAFNSKVRIAFCDVIHHDDAVKLMSGSGVCFSPFPFLYGLINIILPAHLCDCVEIKLIWVVYPTGYVRSIFVRVRFGRTNHVCWAHENDEYTNKSIRMITKFTNSRCGQISWSKTFNV